MRKNTPITSIELQIPDDATLMSTTDTRSHITYANEAFVNVSGFSREALLGQPHNIVRHPDMPPIAFADMWKTLKEGQSWTAIVKNRREDGGYYWVRANVTPIERNGDVVGYMSVRTKPKIEEISQAEALYKKILEGKMKGWTFHKGIIIRSGWRKPFSALQTASMGARVFLACTLGFIGSMFGAGISGASGTSLSILIASALVGGAICYLVIDHQIISPIREIAKEAQRVASGTPASSTGLNRVDEVGMIMRSIIQSGLNLKAMVDDVGIRSDAIMKASERIASGNANISTKTKTQADALEQTATTMKLFKSTAQQNAESANNASFMAQIASDVAVKGGAAMEQVIGTMSDISASSRQISNIVCIIDGITYQTSILSLNASIEAAIAGSQGRGFSVVAKEVRNLAGKSAGAAKEINKIIAFSSKKIDAGNDLINKAGMTMKEIVDSIKKVTDLTLQITAATNDQINGIAQVSESIAMLDLDTRQNSAFVSDISSSADSLKHQAQQLFNAVNAFKHNYSTSGNDKKFHQAQIDNPSGI